MKTKNKIIVDWNDDMDKKLHKAQAILTIKEGVKLKMKDVIDKVFDHFIGDHGIEI